MTLVIEVKSGRVTGVYRIKKSADTRVFVVDLDGEKIGEHCECVELPIEHWSDADEATIKAVEGRPA